MKIQNNQQATNNSVHFKMLKLDAKDSKRAYATLIQHQFVHSQTQNATPKISKIVIKMIQDGLKNNQKKMFSIVNIAESNTSYLVSNLNIERTILEILHKQKIPATKV